MTVKRTPWFIAAGAITGFVGVFGLHLGAAAPVADASGARSPAGSASAGPRASGAGAQAGGGRTATGPAVNFGYGTISVRVTVRGSRILAVSVARLNVFEATSTQISAPAIPVLRRQVIAAQNASIQGVSGATFTSQGYVNSLQAALNDLHG